MNHKRGKPKNARSGCLMCKPWKVNGCCLDKHSDVRRKESAKDQIKYICD